MSTLSQFSGGGVKQIKTGFIKSAAPTNGATPGATSSEDYYYYDITLSGDPVSDITKCVILFDGAGHYSSYGLSINGSSGSLTYFTRIVTARLLNTTTLRLSQQWELTVGNTSAYYNTTGRWTIIEYR